MFKFWTTRTHCLFLYCEYTHILLAYLIQSGRGDGKFENDVGK